jgi:GH24 family phage-related lysozyme (muramidase)
VSFTYNVGADGASKVLTTVNHGHLLEAHRRMNLYNKIKVRDEDGKVKTDKHGRPVMRLLKGLVHRRHDESAPFLPKEKPHATTTIKSATKQ